MVGKSNGKTGKRYEFKEGERIVGIRFKEAKPMYLYNLEFMIANAESFPAAEIELKSEENKDVGEEEEKKAQIEVI